MNAYRYPDGFVVQGTYWVGQNLDDKNYHIIFWQEGLAMAGSPSPICDGEAAFIGNRLPEISDGWPLPMCALCVHNFHEKALSLAIADTVETSGGHVYASCSLTVQEVLA